MTLVRGHEISPSYKQSVHQCISLKCLQYREIAWIKFQIQNFFHWPGKVTLLKDQIGFVANVSSDHNFYFLIKSFDIIQIILVQCHEKSSGHKNPFIYYGRFNLPITKLLSRKLFRTFLSLALANWPSLKMMTHNETMRIPSTYSSMGFWCISITKV